MPISLNRSAGARSSVLENACLWTAIIIVSKIEVTKSQEEAFIIRRNELSSLIDDPSSLRDCPARRNMKVSHNKSKFVLDEEGELATTRLDVDGECKVKLIKPSFLNRCKKTTPVSVVAMIPSKAM